MIAAARAKSRTVAWHVGDMEALPFRDGSFAGVLCTLAIHHFQALLPAFREVFRVLAKGRFVLFTATAEQMRGYWLKAYFPSALERSIAQMPSLPEILHALEQSGLAAIHTEAYEVRRDLQDSFYTAASIARRCTWTRTSVPASPPLRLWPTLPRWSSGAASSRRTSERAASPRWSPRTSTRRGTISSSWRRKAVKPPATAAMCHAG
jgi:SAM-dependent methyltransferase